MVLSRKGGSPKSLVMSCISLYIHDADSSPTFRALLALSELCCETACVSYTSMAPGLCGRVAPHGFKSRIQRGIEDFKKRQADPSILLWHQEPTSAKDGRSRGPEQDLRVAGALGDVLLGQFAQKLLSSVLENAGKSGRCCQMNSGRPILPTSRFVFSVCCFAGTGLAQARSKRSRFMTLFQVATKSRTNFSWESSHA